MLKSHHTGINMCLYAVGPVLPNLGGLLLDMSCEQANQDIDYFAPQIVLLFALKDFNGL